MHAGKTISTYPSFLWGNVGNKRRGSTMILITITSLIALAPVTLGIITIFGRKEKKETEKNEKTSSNQQPTSPAKQSPPLSVPDTNNPASPTRPQEKDSQESTLDSGAASLSQLLSSLLEDIPPTSTNNDDTTDVPRESTFEWVPPITSPPSRKMMVVEDDKGEKILAPAQRQETRFYPFSQPPESGPEDREELTSQRQPDEPVTPPAPKTAAIPQETSKPSKPEKPEKPEPKQKAVATPPRIEQSAKETAKPDASSEIAGGGLDSPGLVLITGPQGSGKTSLVFNVTGKSLAIGTDCILVCYDKAVSSIRDSIKNSGWDANHYESGFHLLLFDAFSGQAESLSTELYCIQRPFDLDELTDTLERNTQMMMTGKVKVIIDSLTPLALKTSSKDLLPKFRALVGKLRETGSTVIVTIDPSKLPKETMASLEEIATSVIELQSDGHNGGQLKVKKVNGNLSRLKPEEFEIHPGKGLLFT